MLVKVWLGVVLLLLFFIGSKDFDSIVGMLGLAIQVNATDIDDGISGWFPEVANEEF